MTLTTRLTAFFLAGLGVTLLAFSTTVFLIVRAGLYAEADARLTATLDMLSAAVEIHGDGVEWEPAERQLGGDGTVRWSVARPDGTRLDASPQPPPGPDGLSAWRLRQTRIPARSDQTAVRSAGEPRKLHPHLDLIATIPLAPIHDTLARLATTLAFTAAVIGAVALMVSRRVCRRALRPVMAMASQAAAMNARDLTVRLPVPAPADELARFGRSFNALLDRVEQAFERQRRFTGDASHELRTPLAAILGQVEVGLRHPRTADEYRRTLEVVRDRGEHLRQIVESLLFLARADAEALPAGSESIDVATWLTDHVETWRDHPRAADVQIVIRGDGPFLVQVHPVLFGQLADNLIDNALKYSPAGSIVTLGVQRSDARVVLTVEDHGMGIPPADLPQLFDPFFRSTDARRAGAAGVGLGLSVARRIAMAFGGTVAVSTEAGRGSRFVVDLPMFL